MKIIVTALGCLALLSCSTGPDEPRSPLLDQVVRAPDVVWSTDTFRCSEIASEDSRLDALSKANEVEKRSLVRERNILLVEWLVPYYGWVATARAGLVDSQIKQVDIVIEDAGDRRQELKQFAVSKGCAGEVATATDLGIAPTALPDRPDALPAIRRDGGAPHVAKPVVERPAVRASAAHARAAPHPVAVTAPVESAADASKPETTTRGDDNSVILPLGRDADVDQAAATITSALQQR
jgi:hypothetical protein